MKLFPAKISEVIYDVRGQHCYRRMSTAVTARFNEFPASKFPAISNLYSRETKLTFSLGTSHEVLIVSLSVGTFPNLKIIK